MFGSRKTLSEEEYVEKVRKHICAAQRARPLFLAMFLLLTGAALFVLYTGPGMISELPYERVMVYAGIFIGITIGFLFIIYVALAGRHLKAWVELRDGFRTEKMMLEYHDRLKAAFPLDGPAVRSNSSSPGNAP